MTEFRTDIFHIYFHTTNWTSTTVNKTVTFTTLFELPEIQQILLSVTYNIRQQENLKWKEFDTSEITKQPDFVDTPYSYLRIIIIKVVVSGMIRIIHFIQKLNSKTSI